MLQGSPGVWSSQGGPQTCCRGVAGVRLACGSPATSNCSAQGLPVTAESGANPTRARAKVGQGWLGEGPGVEAETMRGHVVVELQRGGGSTAAQRSGAGRSKAGRCARVGGGALLDGRRHRGSGWFKGARAEILGEEGGMGGPRGSRPEIAGRRGRCAEQGSQGRRFCPVGPRRQRAEVRTRAMRERGVALGLVAACCWREGGAGVGVV